LDDPLVLLGRPEPDRVRHGSNATTVFYNCHANVERLGCAVVALAGTPCPNSAEATDLYVCTAPIKAERSASALWSADPAHGRVLGTAPSGVGEGRMVVMSVRRALVTGGSRGIGAAVAAALARSGHVVAVQYRTGRAQAEAVLAGLAGSGHVCLAADLTDPEQAGGLVGAAVAA